ncbi:MAG: HlyD family type I secretion periplasmic adaptor subunit [Alphaproteobacteria bacterium]|nr:HlyD family type I secretion periplasmic adaptor subunit [Alphaproteobacteria bacterium]
MALDQSGAKKHTLHKKEESHAQVTKRHGGRALLFGFAIFLGLGVFWASNASIDVISNGSGQVIASARPQIIQNLEGGVLSAMLVRAGDQVTAGQELARLDGTRFSSEVGEHRARKSSLTNAIAREEALLGYIDAFESEGPVAEYGSELAPDQRRLFNARIREFNVNYVVGESQLAQRIQESAEQRSKLENLKRSLALVDERIAVFQPAVENGYVPRVRLLDLQQQQIDIETEMASINALLPKTEAAVREAQQRLAGTVATFRSEILTEISQNKRELTVLSESVRDAEDKLARTVLYSPVDGVVNIVHANTLGGTVRPGGPIIEITPVDDTILVEAKMSPSDIGFLHEGQTADVKLTAYDFSVYGSLTGAVETISADALEDEQGIQYFSVAVRVDQNALYHNGRMLPVVPGMQATVDVLTGERTVLQYLLKPITRAREESFRER